MLLRPAVWIMRRLSYPQRFGVIVIVFVLAIMFLCLRLVHDTQTQIAFTGRELMGVEYLKRARVLAGLVQANRFAAIEYSVGYPGSGAALASLHSQVVKAAAQFDAMPQRGAWTIGEPDPLRQFVSAWGATGTDPSRRADAAYDGQDALAQRYSHMVTDICDRSYLTLDPVLETYYLGDVVCEKIPGALERTGDSHGLLALIWLREVGMADLGLVSRLHGLGAMESDGYRSTERELNKVIDVDSRLERELAPPLEAYRAALKRQRNVEESVLSGQVDTPVEAFIMATPPTVETIDRLNALCLEQLDRLLSQRLHAKILLRNLYVLTAAATLLATAYLFFALYVSITEDLGGEPFYVSDTIKRIAQGRLNTDIALPAGGSDSVMASVVAMRRDLQTVRERELAATVFEASHDGIVIADESQQIVAANAAMLAMMGSPLADVLGKWMWFFLDGLAGFPWADIKQHLVQAHYWQGEVAARRHDGSSFPARLSVTSVGDGGREGHGTFVMMISDVGQQRADSDRIHYLANFDPLTGLPNRRVVFERIERRMSEEGAEHRAFACLFVDLDKFKEINDLHGHSIGDQLLRIIAQRMREQMHAGQTVARFGGDEFLILLDDAEENVMDATAKRLLGAIGEACEIGEHVFHVSASIGMSIYPTHGTTAGSLVQCADMAMYEAKQQGRDRAVMFRQPMLETLRRRTEIGQRLRDAIRNRRLQVRYQPQFRASTLELVGLEALVRWCDDKFGWISPVEFIAIAEQEGLISGIGDLVFEAVLEQLVEWRAKGLTLRPIAINVSAHQLTQPFDLAQSLLAGLVPYDLPPNLIEVEVTETALMQDVEHAGAVLRRLSEAGVAVAVDDFGTGYSSLNYLARLHIDHIKIDRTFIRDLFVNPDDTIIVTTVVKMAQSLGQKVIAEGVETVEQLEFLRSIGCDICQGFYFAPALDASELEPMLEGLSDAGATTHCA